MSEDERKDQGEKPLDIDFDAFEKRIDEEIDRLFIPGDPSPPVAELALDIKPEAAPASLESVKAPILAVNLDVLPTEPAPPAVPGVGGAEKDVMSGALAMDRVGAAAVVRPMGGGLASQVVQRGDLGTLLESFNVAYLSLDWEFSRENISSFEDTLRSLHPYCRDKHESESLFKILSAVLRHLKDQPSSLSPQLVEIIRDIQDLLKTLLLSPDAPNRREKEQFREVVGRLRSFRESIRSKDARQQAREAEPVLGPGDGVPPSAPVSVHPVSDGMQGAGGLRELREWMLSCRFQFHESIKSLEEQNGRLRQMEEILDRKQALAPLVARLSKIRGSLAEHLALVRGKEKEWDERINWLEIYMEQSEVEVPAPVEPGVHEPSLILQPPTSPEEPAHDSMGAEAPGQEHQEQEFCIYRMSGKRFAVPFSNVVKFQAISAGKANKIRKRGHATLIELRPLFRTVKSGLLGAWGEMEAGFLKTLRFVPLPFDALRAPGVLSVVGTVILVSNGEAHGIIFAEPSGAAIQNGKFTPSSGDPDILGVMEYEGGPPVDVLNMDRILNNLKT